MANLNPKPFTLSQKIFRRIFAGKPSLYTDVDINQQGAIDDKTFNEIHETLGAATKDFQPTGVINWNNNLEWTVDFVGGGKLFYKKVQFDIPAFNFVKGGSVPNPALVVLPAPGLSSGVINFYLVAKRYTTTFADDAAIAGVDGVGLASPLPSSDAVRFKDERVVQSIGADVPPLLNAGEEVIILLAQIAFLEDLTSPYGQVVPYLQLNCPDISALENKFFTGSGSVSTNTKGLYSNLVKLADSINKKIDNKVYYLINLLSERPGTIKYFYGTLTGNFNAQGLGIGAWTGYALCNGNTHSGYVTPDIRGRVLLGYHSAIGDASLDYKTIGEIGPPAGTGPDYYQLVQDGKFIKLGAYSMAAHVHSYIDGFLQTNDNSYYASQQYEAVAAARGDDFLPAQQPSTPPQPYINEGSGAGTNRYMAWQIRNTCNGTQIVGSHAGPISAPIENRQPYMVMAVVIKLP